MYFLAAKRMDFLFLIVALFFVNELFADSFYSGGGLSVAEADALYLAQTGGTISGFASYSSTNDMGTNVVDLASKQYVDDNAGGDPPATNTTTVAFTNEVKMYGGLNMYGAEIHHVLGIDFWGNCVAVGENASAVWSSVAYGNNATAEAGGTAVGRYASSIAGGDNGGIAIGSSASACHSAVSVGMDTHSSTESISIGRYAESTSRGVAIGGVDYGTRGSHTDATYDGIAIGRSASAKYYSVSLGTSSYSEHTNIAIGLFAKSYGMNRVSIGSGVSNAVDNSTALRGTLYLDGGTSVLCRSTFGTGAWAPLKGKFVDGSDSADAVYTLGNVGIGTNNPGKKLEVAGTFQAGDTTITGTLDMQGNNVTNVNQFKFQSGSYLYDNGTNLFYINASGTPTNQITSN